MADNTDAAAHCQTNDKKSFLSCGKFRVIKENCVVIIENSFGILKGHIMLFLIALIFTFVPLKSNHSITSYIYYNYIICIYQEKI